MSADTQLQVVTFGLGAEVFAVPVDYVREILDYREPFRIPNGPDYLIGLTDLRGDGVTTVDFRLRLGLPSVPPGPNTRILVVEVPLADRVLTLGLVVDRVLEVRSVDAGEIGGVPDIGVPWSSDYIQGVVRCGQGFILLVDLAYIFAGEAVAGCCDAYA